MLKHSKTTKELKGMSHLSNIVYFAMWPLVVYSNYFKIMSTVTFLGSQTGLISGMFYLKL